MFFSLESAINGDFINHYPLGQLVLNTDNGWHQKKLDGKVYVYKGYLETHLWNDDVLLNIADYQYQGNFLVCGFDPATGVIDFYTNQWRGFLIWADPGIRVSNLYHGSHTIWNDSTVSIDQDLVVSEVKTDIIGFTDLPRQNRQKVEDAIDSRLSSRVSNFLKHNTLPLRVFCSGGIDSTLVWSYVAKYTKDFELVLENRIQWDHFWCRNKRLLQKNFWGYKQIHHWLEECVLTSGAPGDEFMLRSPTTINLWCMYHGIDIFDWLNEGDCLHGNYFKKHHQLFHQQHQDRSLDTVMQLDWREFVRYLCNIVINDCQHWHLGNTLTFTPLRDLDVFKLFLSLPAHELKAQILHSDISRGLIARNDPRLLSVLSDVKNVGESLSNLHQLVPK